MNDNCVRSKSKICKKFCEKWKYRNIVCRVQNCLEFDDISVHISSNEGNLNLIVILALLFKWGGS